jgi:thiamine transport system ATP-binding protein
MLALEQVRFAYRPEEAPWIFNLEVEPGENIGISGASGSGKSTLLDLIAGFLAPQSGDIRLDGVSLLTLPPEERPVSILFQRENLFEHLSAARNLALGVPGRLDAATALAEVGLDDPGSRPVSKLSGGQQQRVALARTLLRDRPVLLLDEPFAALDAETAGAIRARVKSLVKSRRWHTILVSHAKDDMALADRALLLDGKRLVAA